MEKAYECKVLMVQQVCDQCGEGIMKPIGVTLFRNLGENLPSKYLHKCDKCGHEETYSIYYPETRFIPIEPLRDYRGDKDEH